MSGPDGGGLPPLAELIDQLETYDGVGPPYLDPLRQHPDLPAASPEQAARVARVLVELGVPPDLQRAAELAWRAHEAGVAGAGATFATAADRASVLRTRTQRFGTFAYQHKGEHILAPLDGSVSDELRTSIGLGTLAELRAANEAANHDAARARAGEGGLPKGETYARIWRDPSEEELRARWAAEGEPVWADGDELTMVCDRPLEGAIVGPNFELPMWRVGSLLVLTLRVLRLDEAVFTYGFWPLDAEGNPAFSVRPDPDGRFRGINARPAAPTNDVLLGTLGEHTVDSDALGRPRTVTVYTPPGHSPAERLPVVYATDGQFFAPYARRIDAAIEADTTPRCVVVAPHAGRNRTGEYFAGYDASAFERHERFFLDELPAWAEARFGVATERERRAVHGCSDGGAHALATAVSHPERYGHVIAYSSGLPPIGNERWDPALVPAIQLCAGIYEGNFHTATYGWHAVLSLSRIEHHWTERVCGHELIQWVGELPAAITRAFG